jgi:hypothetical protein
MSIRRVVQFLHPGQEHGVDQWHGRVGWKDWNRGNHKRKFLLADGASTRNPQELPTGGIFTFWGEWEPQSQVRRFVRSGRPFRPEYLHLPQLNLEVLGNLSERTEQSCNKRVSCGDTNGPQNTDPLVFGDLFRYVFCQQPDKPKLRSLDKGDIILFGNNKSEMFMLDTVLVVGIYAPIQSGGPLPNWESDLHRRITMDVIEDQIPWCGLRLYGGETWSSEKPFSFVPCRLAEPQPIGFSRPVIRPIGPLQSLISTRLTQGCQIHTLTPEGADAVWSAVVEQVLSHGCALGTAVGEPDPRGRAAAQFVPA